VHTKDLCWSVGTIYDPRELRGVSIACLGIGRGVTGGLVSLSRGPGPSATSRACLLRTQRPRTDSWDPPYQPLNTSLSHLVSPQRGPGSSGSSPSPHGLKQPTKLHGARADLAGCSNLSVGILSPRCINVSAIANPPPQLSNRGELHHGRGKPQFAS
jgi:hypothetical protein